VDEDVVRVLRDGGEGVGVAGVGQGVEVDNLEVPDRIEYEVAPYKAGATGNEDGLFLCLQSAPFSGFRLQVSGFRKEQIADACYLRPVAY
jgi:hypothetical protein